MNSLFWLSDKSTCLLNPRFAEEDRRRILIATDKLGFKETVWLKSSGTESWSRGHKLVALRKSAILAAAQSVNDFFEVSCSDVWLNPLPNFHIGGLSISARCFLSKAKEISLDTWNVQNFLDNCEKEKVSISSLVPTQVFDLVQAEVCCPLNLRFVLVGGGQLEPDLYFQARQFGWPLLPSYGMTETCAVMASASLDSLNCNDYPEMKLLPHAKLISFGEKFEYQSEAKYSGFLFVEEKLENWEPCPERFVLDDHLKVNADKVEVIARESELIKVLGETINISILEKKIATMLEVPCAIVPVRDERKGYDLVCYLESDQSYWDVAELNSRLLPYERLTKIQNFESFPRSALGKILRAKLG